jgi:hypothetical protein
MPSLLRKIPVKMFEITVPAKEKNGKKEDNAIEMLNSSLNELNNGGIEFKTSE